MTRRGRWMRRSVCLACAAGTLVGAAGVRADSSGRAVSCDPSQLVVWLKSRGEPSAGSAWYTFGLTNLSRTRCTTRGYPGVSAVDRAGHQIGSAAARTKRSPLRAVSVDSGGSAQFLLQVSDPHFFLKAACGPTTAAGLRIYLPGATTSTIVPAPVGACANTGPAFLHVAAVTR